MSDLDLCSDDGDSGGPTSHRYFYEMDREQLFTMFVGVVASLRVDAETGCRTAVPAEAMGFSRMARAVQTRAGSDSERESHLHNLATVTRVLLSRSDSRDRGETPSDYEMPMPDLVAHFLELRGVCGATAVPGVAPADAAAASEEAVPTEFIESLRDGPNPDGSPGVWVDDDGRLWTGPDPGDEVSEGGHW